MVLKINLWCTGFKSPPPAAVAWGAILEATVPDGRKKRKIIEGDLSSDMTKNVSDITSVMLGLQCIKPAFRATADVTLYSPPGYALQMLERKPDGLWEFNPKSNQEEVEALRVMANKFAKLEIIKAEPGSKIFKELVSLLQTRTNNARLATIKAAD